MMKTRITKFLPLAAMTFVIMSCAQKGDAYKVTFETQNGTWKASETAYQNEDYVATFVPDEGYNLDEKHLAIKVNNKKIIGGYTFSDNELKIDKDMVTGDMLVQATPKLISYRVFPYLKYMEVTFQDKPYYHKEFVANLKTSEEYVLPDTLTVYVNDTKLTDGVTYNRNLGKLTIAADKVEGDITITGESVALKPVIFKGHGGTWEEGSQIRVYVPDGATFRDAREKASGLIAPTDRKFRRWVYDGTDTTISDSTIISQSGDEIIADARYDVINDYHTVRIIDNFGYFPDNYYRQPVVDKTPFTSFGFDLVIDEKDQGSYYLPDDPSTIKVTMTPPHSSSATLVCFYENPVKVNTRVVKATIRIKAQDGDTTHTTVDGDLTFTFGSSSYQTLDITFDPGVEGKWTNGNNNPRTVALPNDRRFTVFEAALKADNNSMPVANNPSLVFVGWYTDNPTKLINENTYISSSTTYHAKYESVSFENDSWENIINAAEQGLPYLYERYKTNETNILGCQRSVMIGDSTLGYVNVIARVIGVNHDVIAEGPNKDAKTALTFEFQDTFYLSKFSNGSYQYYDESDVRTLIKETLPNKIPEVLKDHIQPVTKSLSKIGVQTDLIDKFFLLSANELGLRQGDLPDPETPVKGDEGSTYAFYESAHTAKDLLKKGSQIVGDSTYWIRSGQDDRVAYAINGDGICVALSNFESEHGLAPAFSIGVANYEYLTEKGKVAPSNDSCSTSISEFLIGKNTAGQFNNVLVTATPGYLFMSDPDLCYTPTNCEIFNAVVSSDLSSLVCSISYTVEDAATKNISVEFTAILQGYASHFSYSNCYGSSGFSMETGTGTTHQTFIANDGYSFPSSTIPNDIFRYNTNVYTIKNIIVSGDGKTLECDIDYNLTGGKNNLDITVIAKEGEVNFIKLNTQHCTSTFVSTPIQGSTGEVSIEITPESGYEFDSSNNYKNSITVGYPSGMSVNYEITENSSVLTIELGYGITSRSGDITISARAFRPGACTITADDNCKVNVTAPVPYYCEQDVSIQVTATVLDPENYTFLDMFDSEIVTVNNQTLRGIVKVSSLEIQDGGKTVVLTISIDRTASCCNDIQLTIQPRQIIIPE